jgi:hypothetical protein
MQTGGGLKGEMGAYKTKTEEKFLRQIHKLFIDFFMQL